MVFELQYNKWSFEQRLFIDYDQLVGKEKIDKDLGNFFLNSKSHGNGVISINRPRKLEIFVWE